MLKALILGENEALKKVEILSLSQELVVSVHFCSNATRTHIAGADFHRRNDFTVEFHFSL